MQRAAVHLTDQPFWPKLDQHLLNELGLGRVRAVSACTRPNLPRSIERTLIHQ
jgi:hypothetical protein